MSTCSMKCTPPDRSSPSDMGVAPRLRSHSGVVDALLSATMKASEVALMASSALSVIALSFDSIGIPSATMWRLPLLVKEVCKM